DVLWTGKWKENGPARARSSASSDAPAGVGERRDGYQLRFRAYERVRLSFPVCCPASIHEADSCWRAAMSGPAGRVAQNFTDRSWAVNYRIGKVGSSRRRAGGRESIHGELAFSRALSYRSSLRGGGWGAGAATEQFD